MKKELLKKISGLLVCLSLVASLAACGGNDSNGGDKPAEPTVTEEPAAPADTSSAESVAEAYLEAASKVDAEEALKYVQEDTDLYDEIKAGDVEAMLDGMVSEMGLDEDAEKEIRPMVEDLLDAFAKAGDWEITNIDEDEAEATVEYVITTLDFESGMGDAEEAAMEAIFEKYTEEELSAMEGDQEKMSEVMIEMVDVMFDTLAESDTTEVEGTLTLENVDGEWLVTAKKDK